MNFDRNTPLPPEAIPAEVLETPVLDRVFGFAETSPDSVAIVASCDADTERRLTYAELRQTVTRIADGLRRLGVAPGDRIGLLLNNDNGYQALISIFATTLSGAVFVPLNARSAPRELKDALRRSGTRIVIAARDQLPKLTRIRADLPALDAIVAVDAAEGYALTLDQVLDNGSPDAQGWPRLAPEGMSEIMFTSGTTAAPKAAIMTHGRTAASAHIYSRFLHLTGRDVMHSFFPVFTTACTKCAAFPVLSSGGTIILDPKLDMTQVLARMGRERSTIYYGVPSFYVFLLDHLGQHACALPDIRLFAYGGAAMPGPAIAELTRRFPGVETLQTFGATETGGTGSVLLPADATRKAGSVGRAVDFTQVKLIDDAGNEVPEGTEGHFAVRSPANFKAYLDDPANTDATLKDGWVLTGDVGKRDADGFLYHLDRTKDIIIRGGHNIGSMEIESVLYQHPGIVEAAAVAVPHPKLGEDIFVFVTGKEDHPVSAEEILAYCRENLADYKVPRHLSFIDEMPKNPMGKIVKTELRERAKAALDGQTAG